jgi:hypothetical protein
MKNLIWMQGTNFGDAINPYLFKYIAGVEPHNKNLGFNKPSYMMVGSIINQAKPKTIVWGVDTTPNYVV